MDHRVYLGLWLAHEAPRVQCGPVSDDDVWSRNPSAQAESLPVAEIGIAEVPAGGLYVAWGAVTAHAVAGAVAERQPRRRAYLRHVVCAAVLFVGIGVAMVIALAMLFD